MNVQEQINSYIANQPASKRDDMQALHLLITGISPGCKLWFLDGRNSENKIISNPNIGYGTQEIKHCSGETKEFYQIGLSANTTGISIYLIGIKNNKYLFNVYGGRIGKAKVTGYCVSFRHLKDINVDILGEMVEKHMDSGSGFGL